MTLIQTCFTCKKQYDFNNSDATYMALFCSLKCEEKDFDRMEAEEYKTDVPSEYLKDDMSNL